MFDETHYGKDLLIADRLLEKASMHTESIIGELKQDHDLLAVFG